MASGVKECNSWGVIGCGWLGQAFARSVADTGGPVWGTGRQPSRLAAIARSGARALQLDLQNAASGLMDPATLPEFDHLLIALPPGACVDQAVQEWLSSVMDIAAWSVVISSTSVYDEAPGQYTEADAVRRTSRHSGVSVLDVETALAGPRVTLLRAGGLVGPGRPLIRSARPVDLQRPIVAVHSTDVIRAIHHAARMQLSGPVNITCPIQRNRAACLGKQEGMAMPSAFDRSISSARLLDSGFTFTHPDPARMPDLQP